MVAFTVRSTMFPVIAMLRFEPLSFAIGSSIVEMRSASPRVAGENSEGPGLQVIEHRRPRRLHLMRPLTRL
jgi:hypothetical protein